MVKTLYPQMNQYIIDAVENGSLIIFIGAGISALYGYPTWDGLAKKLLDLCESENKITKSQKAVLLSDSFDSMKRVTIACNKLGDNLNGLKHVRDILGKEVEGKEQIKKLNEISRYLAAYNCPIITTNADTSLDNTEAFENRLILPSFINWDENYDNLSLIHLHGSIDEPENMIFTSQGYAKAYRAKDEQNFGGKLFKIFKEERTILFIGYGMEEFELIQYFISDPSRKIPNRFMLKGYLEKDKLAEEFDREYFKSLGIELISFSKETKGYDALISVLKKWDKTIKTETMAHRRIKDVISELCDKVPNPQSKKLLEGFLNDNKLLVVKGICTSPYIDQYILELKDNNSLFSIKDNLHPCNEIEPEKYVVQYWNGLDILETYSKNKELNNQETNSFIISLMNSVIDIMTNDKEIYFQKRFSSNWGNMRTIYSIITSNAIFIKEIRVLDFVKEFLSNKMNICDVILSITRDNKENFFLNDGSLFFDIHELFIELDNEDVYYGYLYGQSIEDFIKRAPYKYFLKSKKWIEKTECIFSTMGAIEEYSREAEYKIDKEDVLFDWFKQSAKYINEDLIEDIIQEYLNSEKKLLNKIAVFLLSIRFDEVKNLLFEKLNIIIRNHNVYSDLRLLLENNVSKMTEEEKEKIYDCVQDNEIDVKGGRISPLLKNRLYMILSLNGFKCSYRQETPKEKEIVNNYNKLISFSNRAMDEDISSCKSEMDTKSFNEIISDYYVDNKSYYFGEVINKSVWLYIQENNINICEYVDDIPEILSISLINTLIENKDYDCLTNYITLFIKKDYFEREALQTIFYALRTIYENNNEKTDIILKFDYKKIPVSSIESEQLSVVTEIINESVFEYLDLLSIVAYENDLIRERFFEATNYFMDKDEQGWKIKAVLGYLIQRILDLDKEFLKRNIDNILDNNRGNINPSYHTISWSNSYSEELFDYLVKRKDFMLFFQEPDSKIEDSISIKKGMLAKVIKYYYKTSKGLDELKNIIQLIYKYSMTRIYSQLSLEIYIEKKKEISEINTQRIELLIKYIDESDFINKLGPNYNYDYLSREIAILIIRANNCSKLLWKQFLVAFENFNRFFYDEIYELVKEYKNSEYENIRKLLMIYFNKYTPYSANEETIKNVYNTIKDEPKYAKDARKWRTTLTKINPDLDI